MSDKKVCFFLPPTEEKHLRIFASSTVGAVRKYKVDIPVFVMSFAGAISAMAYMKKRPDGFPMPYMIAPSKSFGAMPPSEKGYLQTTGFVARNFVYKNLPDCYWIFPGEKFSAHKPLIACERKAIVAVERGSEESFILSSFKDAAPKAIEIAFEEANLLGVAPPNVVNLHSRIMRVIEKA